VDLTDLVHTVGRRLLREPLLHFAVLGALVFAGYRIVAPAVSDPAEIVVTTDRIASLAAQFKGMHGGRPPREDELRATIDSYVRDEMLYREGLALGLDRDDPVVRNRVRQKASMLNDDAMTTEPTDADLEAYLKAHQGKFDIPARLTFEQVYFDPAKHRANLNQVIADARAALADGGSAEALGDPTLLPPTMSEALPADIKAAFGDSFAEELSRLHSRGWEGPLRSTFGVHLARVTWHDEPRQATLADARDVIAREWSYEQVLKAREQLYRTLAQRYRVRVEPYVNVVQTAGR
jgi:PPIC-type PPIASE domain